MVFVVLTFEGRAEAVRDVQFSPFYSNYFAAAFDNGSIQVKSGEKLVKVLSAKCVSC